MPLVGVGRDREIEWTVRGLPARSRDQTRPRLGLLRRRPRGRGRGRLAQLDPVSLALEWIRGQDRLAPLIVAIEPVPVDVRPRARRACRGSSGSRASRRGPSGARAARHPRPRARSAAPMPEEDRRGSDLDEHPMTLRPHRADGLDKPHGLAQMTAPVRGARPVGGGRHRPRHAGHHGIAAGRCTTSAAACSKASSTGSMSGECDGVGDRQARVSMPAASNSRTTARTHALAPEMTTRSGPLTAAIARLAAYGATEAFTPRLLREDGRHLPALGAEPPQPAARGDELQSVLEAHHARDARGGVLAEAVAQHRRRLDAPRPPQLRERVLEGEDGRLRVRGLVEEQRRRHASGTSPSRRRLVQ